MNSARAESTCAICVDMGTTNTRVWMTRGAEVLARAQAGVGVRDTARDGTPARIRTALRDLIRDVREQARSRAISEKPSSILAAGMITSPLGLAEVPHVSAPAGIRELATAVQRCEFPEITDLPILLIPGVRSGPPPRALAAIVETDVMRGEETLCLGLLVLGLAQPPATVLNLGSHWKAIQLDAEGRIHSSVTSLSGELIHAAQTQTILASAVPRDRPTTIDADWCRAGMREQRRSGLPRALFCVRLLELHREGTPDQRLSFLVGAFVASDLDALRARGVLAPNAPVLLSGGGALARAWQQALAQDSLEAPVLADSQIESALLAGLQRIAG